MKRNLLALALALAVTAVARAQLPPDPANPGPRPPAYILPPKDLVPEVDTTPAPFVDDSPVGKPGFFANLELFLFQPHLLGQYSGSPNAKDTVNLETGGSLGTVASPSFTLGYRLPQQLGEFSVTYRFEEAERTEVPTDLLGGTSQRDRLSVNLVDLDWAHRNPFALEPGWDLRFNVGIRLGTVYFDTERTFAPPGNVAGQTQERVMSTFLGIGPEAGFELSREIPYAPALKVFSRCTGASLFGNIDQAFSETTAAGFSIDSARNQVAVPMLTVQVGLAYAPPWWPGTYFSAGYLWEEYWQVGRLDTTSTTGNNADLLNRGFFLQAVFNY